jgi:hypothetical protein
MKAVAETIKSFFDETTGRIHLLTALKNVFEIDPPDDVLPGIPVENLRWIREIQETFTSSKLEVQSVLVTSFSFPSTVLYLEDASRFPNRGSVILNRGSSTEETLSYTGRDISLNRLTGVSIPTNLHIVGERALPSVAIDFLGKYEVDLAHFPIRFGSVKVILNGVTELREVVDFTIINDFIGNNCIRGKLQFTKGNEPRRFRPEDFLEVTYQYFDQSIESVKIHTSPGVEEYINVYETSLFEQRFDELSTPDREAPSRGNIRITPPFSTTTFPPLPVKVSIPDTRVPSNIVLGSDITPSSVEIPLSSVDGLPRLNALLDATDDLENRTVTIEGNLISYTDIDTVANKLTGVTGINANHSIDTPVVFDGARFTRDIVKDAINKSSLRGQLEAISENAGGRFLMIKTKITGRSFSLQPGTYSLFFVGFSDDLDRGLHEIVTTSVSFENRDLTFSRYTNLIERHEIARRLLGKTISRRVTVF